jgi:beta-lactam-binding protein with PASTA domain
MPDLQGLSARDALRRLVNLGLTARVQGNGFVVAQDPPAGTALDTVGQCRLTLDRQRVARYDHRAQP